MSTPADVLAEQVCAGLRESIESLRAIQREAAADLYAGVHAQAGGRLKALFSGWSEFLQAVRQVLPSLDPARGAKAERVFGQTASVLSRLHQALSRRDWVETADLLTLEGEGLLEAWSESLAGPPAPGGQ